ncbi:MAG: hypothetical protein FWB95_08480 [Treponema sp.]|nr:hypothetical protein [Treponema sp.]
MKRFLIFLLTVCVLVCGVSAQDEHGTMSIENIEEEISDLDNESQEKTAGFADGKSGFWFGFGGDTAMYSQYGFAFGPSFSIGFGTGMSIGINAAWFFTKEEIDVLEINVFFRIYFFKNADNGPYIQIMAGPSLFNRSGDFSVPSNSGTISAGAVFGWRFLLFNMWYIEPSIRGGYPFLFGATVSTGIQF